MFPRGSSGALQHTESGPPPVVPPSDGCFARCFRSCLPRVELLDSPSLKSDAAKEYIMRHQLSEKLNHAVSVALFTPNPESVISTVLQGYVATESETGIVRFQALVRGVMARRLFIRSTKTRVLIIMDPGQDLDDEMTLVMLRALTDRSLVSCLGIVTTLAPASMRAQLAHGTLCKLGLSTVPVAAGSDGGSSGDIDGMRGVRYVDYVHTAYLAQSSAQLMSNVMRNADDRSVTVVVVASLRDIADQLKAEEDLFKQKVKEVVVMGGVQQIEPGELLVPDSAHNNQFDSESAAFFYRRCQEIGVPLLVVSRFAAYTCQLPRSIYDDMAATGSNVGEHLKAMQAQSIEKLWRRANEPEGSALRAGLPMRCDRKWFCETFCAGQGLDRDGSHEIWDLIQGFNMYDPLALVAALPQLSHFFDFTCHRVNNVTHRVIGTSAEQTGIQDGQLLQRFLYAAFLDGIQGEIVKERQRRELVERQRRQLQSAMHAITALKRHNDELFCELGQVREYALSLKQGGSSVDNTFPPWRRQTPLERWWYAVSQLQKRKDKDASGKRGLL